jgi:hypothetical protein
MSLAVAAASEMDHSGQRLGGTVGVVGVVVEVKGEAQPPAAAAGSDPSLFQLWADVAACGDADDRRVPCWHTNGGTKPVGQSYGVVVEYVDADLGEQFEGRGLGDPGVPRW